MRAGLLYFATLASFVTSIQSLSSKQRRIKKVAIVGAGISGLSVAHSLTNSPSLKEKYECSSSSEFEVSIYDSRLSLDTRAGAGVQLNGGLAVLGWINPKVQSAVLASGLPQVSVQSRTKAWNDKDPFDTLFQRDLLETVIKKGGDVAKKLIDKDNKLLWTAIMRGALQQSLIDTLPDRTRSEIAFGKNLIGIKASPGESGGCLLEFSDGTTTGPFDLVVGCDGIKSACKEYIETGKVSADASKREGASAAIYSGIRIKYAIRDGLDSDEQQENVGLTQYFGDGAYALDGTYGAGDGKPNTRSAFLISLDEDYIGPFRKKKKSTSASAKENSDWTQDVEVTLDTERDAMKEAAATAGITNIDIGPTIDSADRIFSLGVYYHNPLTLFGWSKKVAGSGGAQVVLVGDAAHALPPFLGQGSNQAVQDAYCLATNLYEYNHEIEKLGEESASLKRFLKSYERLRWRPTFDIFLKSIFLGYLETGGPGGFYSKFRDVFFKTMGVVGVAERVLLSAASPKV
mmetsp:Transcript_20984/g.27120  ORF Transcript_20984/g.27120 Transcript_20984/m.27120 type:complete len:516 (-) Transcript_20984:92-1639(-)|eukprot:CAMPEP_0198136424 /NCGR_PEP_ID=MMETSP1443-20131203/67_1 /TAXON_ID=186043 /ORGANISM="Entomoneis sp., Strain CCMP2396" /LENGTH=515 /DNA_ID=CAMNT_0043797643 /DNA_START=59 /DNA_END=1606 /DNA_ORIENTATION=+